MTKSFALLPVAALFASLSLGCEEEPGTTAEDAFLKNVEKTGGKSQKWIYEGWLPKLDEPVMFVSLKAHTARVTGLLPQGFSGQLPFYARTKLLTSGRTQMTVVYPIATGAIDPSTGKAPAGPGHYPKLYAVPFTPTNEKAAWGGFPFMKYHASRGLAFHGPITSTRNADTGDWEWILKRGPVSHGCNRMQGEHVVELAHVLGMDMSVPHSSGETAQLPVGIDVSNEFDTFDGKFVDVDYPALAAVKRPTGNVDLFTTWDSRNLPQIVCAYDKNRPADGQHCANAGQIKQDYATGEMLIVPDESPWIGSVCSTDADCGFNAGGEAGHCIKDGSDGYCSIECEGYCPDKDGHAPTFCAKTADGGQCLAKAAPENEGCASIPGTTAAARERFIGSSGATAKVATVCTF
jgi:hypothetical protein